MYRLLLRTYIVCAYIQQKLGHLLRTRTVSSAGVVDDGGEKANDLPEPLAYHPREQQQVRSIRTEYRSIQRHVCTVSTYTYTLRTYRTVSKHMCCYPAFFDHHSSSSTKYFGCKYFVYMHRGPGIPSQVCGQLCGIRIVPPAIVFDKYSGVPGGSGSAFLEPTGLGMMQEGLGKTTNHQWSWLMNQSERRGIAPQPWVEGST